MQSITTFHLAISLLLLSYFITGCAQGMQINEYPISQHAGRGCLQCLPASHSKYWSAYVRLESSNIPIAWSTSSLDYILITAKAKIPTRNGPLVRDFPLFTIKNGQVQSQSGVDLLKKIPLSQKARDQVAITIEVRFIRKKWAMDTVQKILKEVTKVAEPYLNSYPIASQIIGSAVPLIDQLTPNEKMTPSSATTLIVPEELGGTQKIVAFILLPLSANHRESKSQSRLDNSEIYECSNMRGALCRKDDKSVGTSVSLASEKTSALPATTEKLDELRHLREIVLISHYRTGDEAGAYAFDAEAWNRFKGIVAPILPDVSLLRLASTSHADLKRALDGLVESYSRAFERSLAKESASAQLYQKDRIKDVVYLTVSFRGYDGVFDPMILLRDALSDCDRITSTSIQQAGDYLSANEDLFAPEDVDLAKRSFRLGRLLLALREYSAKRSYDDILTLFDVAQPRVGESVEGLAEAGTSDDLEIHYRAVNQCIVNTAGSSPASTLRKIWQIFRNESMDAEDDVRRLDLIGHALGELAAISGLEYAVDAVDPFPKLSNPMIQALHQEAQRLYSLQPTQGLSTVSCASDEELKLHAKRTSLVCSTCWTDLRKACSRVPDANAKLGGYRAWRRQQVLYFFATPITFDPGNRAPAGSPQSR